MKYDIYENSLKELRDLELKTNKGGTNLVSLADAERILLELNEKWKTQIEVEVAKRSTLSNY